MVSEPAPPGNPATTTPLKAGGWGKPDEGWAIPKGAAVRGVRRRRMCVGEGGASAGTTGERPGGGDLPPPLSLSMRGTQGPRSAPPPSILYRSSPLLHRVRSASLLKTSRGTWQRRHLSRSTKTALAAFLDDGHPNQPPSHVRDTAAASTEASVISDAHRDPRRPSHTSPRPSTNGHQGELLP